MGRHLITSALPYINGVKHLGNLVGSMLPADVYARFLRARGHEVLFICATDEHGTPAELAAARGGAAASPSTAPSSTRSRTTSGGASACRGTSSAAPRRRRTRELTQHFAERCATTACIEERVTDQVYSLDDGRFLPDRYIVGTCPLCGYERARRPVRQLRSLLDPADLIDPYPVISGSTRLEVREHAPPLPAAVAAWPTRVRAWVDTQDRLADPGRRRSPASTSTRG